MEFFETFELEAFPLMGIVGVSTLIAYYGGKASKLIKLPSIIGYMTLGVLLGPSLLNWVGEHHMDGLGFITQLALGFVAFSIGSELSLVSLRRQGVGIISIILAESFTAFFVVFGAVYLLTGDIPLALVFGAVAPASAPAGTVAVIQEYRAKGSLTKALYAVVGFDDGLAIIIFGFASAIATRLLKAEAGLASGSFLSGLWHPVYEIGFSLLIGAVIGIVFCQLVNRIRNRYEVLVVTFGVITLAVGFCEAFGLSLILTNMVIGFVMINTRGESLFQKVSEQTAPVMPLLFVLFFFLAGAHLKVAELPAMGLIGGIYILARSGGLILGARIGSLLGHVEEKIKKYIGLGILSQAGVAIGLSLIIKENFDKIGTPHADQIGATIITTVTATCIFFEIVGPIGAKYALRAAGEIKTDTR